MSKIRSRDTKPELLLRRQLWSEGLRGYRVHPKAVYGKPDIAYIRRRVAVFVDGCFWHACPDCHVPPSSNREYWGPKIARNSQRDIDVTEHLTSEGWTVVRVWEHEIEKDLDKAADRVRKALCD